MQTENLMINDPVVSGLAVTKTGIRIGCAYQRRMPELSRDGEALQATLLCKPQPEFEELKSPLWMALVLGAGLVGLLVAVFR